jgi:predicted transcriptional regulator of viral defense system
MRYIDLENSFKDFTIFSLSDIRRIDASFHRRRLNEWQDRGYIKKITRGYYINSDLEIDEHVLFEIANRIYRPSYISLETALSYYHLIPESVYGISSASTRRTYTFKTPIGEFSYKTIKPQLFFGYDLVGHDNRHSKIASIEKAILDFLYLNPHINAAPDFASLRINTDIFLKQAKEERLYGFLDRFAKKTLAKRVKSFLRFIKNA